MENATPILRTLPNGVRLLALPMPHVRSVSVGVFLRVGSRDETPATNGISHVLEHMAFKGTITRSVQAINLDAERLGADVVNMHAAQSSVKKGETLIDTGLVEGSNAAWNSEHVLVDDTPRARAASVLLASFVSGPFFGEMRTRQQLGYIAGAGGAVSVRERGLNFVIQSSTHPSAELRQRAETFMAGLPTALAALSGTHAVFEQLSLWVTISE